MLILRKDQNISPTFSKFLATS